VDVDAIEVSIGVCSFLPGVGVVNDKDDDVAFAIDVAEEAGCRCGCEDDEEIDADRVLFDEVDVVEIGRDCLENTLTRGGDNEVDRR
jgi:hypothetical protein